MRVITYCICSQVLFQNSAVWEMDLRRVFSNSNFRLFCFSINGLKRFGIFWFLMINLPVLILLKSREAKVKRCHTEPLLTSYHIGMCCVRRSCWLEEEAGSCTAEDCYELNRWRINESCLNITALETSCFQLEWLVFVSCWAASIWLQLDRNIYGTSDANTNTTLCSRKRGS